MSNSRKSAGSPSQPDQREGLHQPNGRAAAGHGHDGITLAQPMLSLADALRWALRRIETAGLGQGEYFERADALLASAETLTNLAEGDLIHAESRFGSIAHEARCVEVLHDEVFECKDDERRGAFLTAAAALMRSITDHAEQGERVTNEWRQRRLKAERQNDDLAQGHALHQARIAPVDAEVRQ